MLGLISGSARSLQQFSSCCSVSSWSYCPWTATARSYDSGLQCWQGSCFSSCQYSPHWACTHLPYVCSSQPGGHVFPVSCTSWHYCALGKRVKVLTELSGVLRHDRVRTEPCSVWLESMRRTGFGLKRLGSLGVGAGAMWAWLWELAENTAPGLQQGEGRGQGLLTGRSPVCLSLF